MITKINQYALINEASTKTEKIFSIEKSGSRADKIITGTLEYLTDYFSYTLLCGNSYNFKIDKNPKTIKSLVSNLNKSVDETQSGSYNRDSYREVPNPENYVLNETKTNESNASTIAEYYLDSNNTTELYKYILESYINGQPQQCKEIYNQLDSDSKSDFRNYMIEYLSDSTEGRLYDNINNMWKLLTDERLSPDGNFDDDDDEIYGANPRDFENKSSDIDLEDILDEPEIIELQAEEYSLDYNKTDDGSDIEFISLDIPFCVDEVETYEKYSKWFKEYCTRKGWDYEGVNVDNETDKCIVCFTVFNNFKYTENTSSPENIFAKNNEPLYHDINFSGLKKSYTKFNPSDKNLKIFNWFKKEIQKYKMTESTTVNEKRHDSTPKGWSILPAGTINLTTGDSTHFNLIENNLPDIGSFYLVKRESIFHVYSTSGEISNKAGSLIGTVQLCHHDQNLREYDVEVIGVYPSTLEGLTKAKKLIGKNTAKFSVFK
jgi:hypothetical protein